MNISLKSLIVPGVIILLALVSWISYASYKVEKKRADDAEQSATSAVTITDNALQTIKITNIVMEANQHAKNQIALDSQSAQKDIRVAVAGDSCADRPVPAAAVKRLHDYANGLREGASGSAASKPYF